MPFRNRKEPRIDRREVRNGDRSVPDEGRDTQTEEEGLSMVNNRYPGWDLVILKYN